MTSASRSTWRSSSVKEIWVAHAARILVPLDLDGIRHAADPVPFGPGADVDQLGAGGETEQVVCFGRRQRALVGQAEGLGTLAGEVDDLGQFSHGILIA